METSNFNSVKSMVEQVLVEYPRARNSDVLLTLMVWLKNFKESLFQDSNGEWCVRLKDVKKLPKEDNCKRIRAKFNQDNLYLATDPVVLERRNREMGWKKDLGYATEKGVSPTPFNSTLI